MLRSNQQYEIHRYLPDIGSQIRNCYYLVRDSQEAKVQKILLWSDFGPLRSLEDKSIQSLLKSISQIEVNNKGQNSIDGIISQHPFIEKPEFLTSTESGILSISKYRKVWVGDFWRKGWLLWDLTSSYQGRDSERCSARSQASAEVSAEVLFPQQEPVSPA